MSGEVTTEECLQNGVYRCDDRTPKFDMARIREMFTRRDPSRQAENAILSIMKIL